MSTKKNTAAIALLASFLICALAVGAGLWAITALRKPPPAEPPQVDLTQSPAGVVKAIEQARERVIENPQSGEAWGGYAMCLCAHAFDVEANFCFEQAERLAPENSRWPYLRGVNLAVSDGEAAMACYRRTIELDDRSVTARYRLGEELLARGEAEQAQEQFSRALIKDAGNARALLGLARAAWLEGDVNRSRSLAEKAVEAAPGQRSVHELLAKIYHRTGDSQRAQRQLEILRTIPSDATEWPDHLVVEMLMMRRDPEFLLNQVQRQLGEGKSPLEVLPEIRRIVEQNPGNSEYHALLAQVLTDNHRIEEAAEVLDEALKQHRRSSTLWRQRGDVYYRQSQWEQAAKVYREAIRWKQDNASAHDGLGNALLMLGDEAGTLNAFQYVVRLRPSLAGGHANLGRLLLRMGREQEGEKHLKIAADLASDDSRSRP